MTDPRPNARGFVLLMTLLLLALAAVVLLGITRRSLEHATLANLAQQNFQRDWGRRSIEGATLHRAAAILDHVAKTEPEVAIIPRLTGEIHLGNWQFAYALSDEQAKLNLNVWLLDQRSALVNHLVAAAVNEADIETTVRVRPQKPSRAEEDHVIAGRPIGSFAQVLSPASAHAVLGLPQRGGIQWRPGVADKLTLWGDGRLALRRANSATVRAVLAPSINDQLIQNLLDAREQNPDAPFETVLARIQLTDGQRELFETRLTLNSRVFSLAIHATTGSRQRTTLRVIEWWPTGNPLTGELERERTLTPIYHGFDW